MKYSIYLIFVLLLTILMNCGGGGTVYLSGEPDNQKTGIQGFPTANPVTIGQGRSDNYAGIVMITPNTTQGFHTTEFYELLDPMLKLNSSFIDLAVEVD